MKIQVWAWNGQQGTWDDLTAWMQDALTGFAAIGHGLAAISGYQEGPDYLPAPAQPWRWPTHQGAWTPTTRRKARRAHARKRKRAR